MPFLDLSIVTVDVGPSLSHSGNAGAGNHGPGEFVTGPAKVRSSVREGVTLGALGSAGAILGPGDGRSLSVPSLRITLKIPGERSRAGSLFEIVAPAGFDVGAHVHSHSEEFFYVLDGAVDLLAFEPVVRTAGNWQAWRSADGDRAFRGGPGAMMHVPAGCPHAFANPGPEPVRLLFQSSPPPDHERYFEELVDLLAGDTPGRPEAIAALRERYDIHQLTPLIPGDPLPDVTSHHLSATHPDSE